MRYGQPWRGIITGRRRSGTRAGDAIDLDGDGPFDDDVFISTFQANDLHLTDNRLLNLLVSLRNGADTNLGDAFLRMTLPFPGDLDCDGVIDFDDISPFVLALSDPVTYQAAYPGCDIRNADCNGDGLVNFDDINAFVALLSGG